MSDIPLEEEAWWTLLYFRLEACAKTSSQGRLLKEGEQGYGTRWLAGGTTTAVVGAAPGRMEIIREGSNEAAIEPGPASDVPGTSVLYHDQEGQGGDGISGFILQDGTTLWYARSSHDAARRPDFPFYCLAGSTLVCVDVVFCGQEPGVIQVHTPEPGATLMFARCAFEENTVMAVAAGTKSTSPACTAFPPVGSIQNASLFDPSHPSLHKHAQALVLACLTPVCLILWRCLRCLHVRFPRPCLSFSKSTSIAASA